MNTSFLNFLVSIGNLSAEIHMDYLSEIEQFALHNSYLHEHTCPEVYFVEQGFITIQFEQESLRLREHDILIIPPNSRHRILSFEPNIKRFAFLFLLKDAKYQMPKTPYVFFHPTDKKEQEIFNSIRSIHDTVRLTSSESDLFRLNAHFSILLSHVLEHAFPSLKITFTENQDSFACFSPNSMLQQYDQFDIFFRNHFAEPLTIQDLADEFDYSKTQIGRILYQCTGMTFSEKLTQARLTAALRYLNDTDLSIPEIAEKCGYSSRRGFELMFRKHTGVSPITYRNKDSRNQS